MTQEKNLCSLVLKLKVFYFRVFTGQTTRCMVQLVLFLKNIPGTFFQRDTSSEAVVIAIVEADPPVYIGDCCSCVHLHVFFPKKPQIGYNQLSPHTHFYIALYFHLCGFQGITFTRPVFLFKIDHDDGTTTGILSHLNTIYEQSNDRHFIYRHIGSHCINQKPPYCFI